MMSDRVQSILERHTQADTLRSFLASTWRDISDYVRPVKQDIGTEPGIGSTPNMSRLAALFDTTAIDANRTYAAGCMSWMTPSETVWFGFDAPKRFEQEDETKRWYAQCSSIAQEVLASSNFYQQIHESYLDDGAFGTSGLLVEEDDATGIRFEALQIGEYSVLENDRREVDTLFRTLKLTPRQAEQKFGRSALPEHVLQLLDTPTKGGATTHEYLHCIMPRTDYERGKIDAANMPWASTYIEKKSKTIVRESGAWEKPMAVHRHLLWSRTPYGISPGMQALGDCRQLNLMQQYLDTLVEQHVTPPTLVPSGFEGRIDLRAGGMTFFKSLDQKPQFWENRGNPMIGEDRTVFRQRQINRAFHVELFQALNEVPIGKEMTAAEVHMRQRDRLTLFSPTFARKNQELNTPVIKRVFGILLRAGAFPPPPQSLVQLNPDGLPFIPDPQITYMSRLALQIRAIHNESYMRTMSMLSPVVEMNPGIMDLFDFDRIAREVARNEGLNEEWMRPVRDVEAIRQQRALAQQQAQEQMAAKEEAETLAKFA
jgi:hypothetical protein